MKESKPHSVSATPDAPPVARFEWSQSPFEAFLESHFKKVLLGLGAVALGVGGWLVLRQKTEEKLDREGQAFTAADTLDDYKKIIANYPGSVAAGSAQLMIANLLSQNNDLAGAIDELQKFITGYPSHPLIDQAAFRIAVLTIEKGETKSGVEKLEAFVNQYPQSSLRGLAQLQSADALVTLGDRDKALALYTTISRDSALAGTAERSEAETRIAQVKLKPPVEVEFVPEPPPPPPVAPPGAPTAPGVTPEVNAPALNLEAPAPAPVIPEGPPAVPEASPPATPTPEPPADPAPPK